MEQNKNLLIIVSVALFLSSLLGVGLWLFYPRGKPAETGLVATIEQSPDFDPIEWVRTKEEFPQLQPKEEEKKEDVVILYGEKTEKKQVSPALSAPATAPEPARQIPPKVLSPTPSVTKKPAPPVSTIKKAPEKDRTAAVPKTVTVKEYSIQVGSFTSPDKAEEAGKLLKAKGLNGQIVVRDVAGIRYYRLRIGPYENKEEAEKFLSWVKEIRGFENSMIFEGRGTRTIAN